MTRTQDFFEKFQQYAISKEEMEQIMGGVRSEYKNGILQKLINKVREIGTLHNCKHSVEIDWNIDLADWKHTHFRHLEYMTGISLSSLRNWISKEKWGFKTENQQKVADFLDCEDWQSLENQVHNYLKNIKPK